MNLTTVESQLLALLAQVLRMLLALVTDVQSVRSIQRPLLVWVHVEAALDAHLTTIGPTVATHPLAPTGGALVFSEAALLPLVWRQSCRRSTCRHWGERAGASGEGREGVVSAHK